jgi:hypothetical protein
MRLVGRNTFHHRSVGQTGSRQIKTSIAGARLTQDKMLKEETCHQNLALNEYLGISLPTQVDRASLCSI